jgi:hypothetical protein
VPVDLSGPFLRPSTRQNPTGPPARAQEIATATTSNIVKATPERGVMPTDHRQKSCWCIDGCSPSGCLLQLTALSWAHSETGVLIWGLV